MQQKNLLRTEKYPQKPVVNILQRYPIKPMRSPVPDYNLINVRAYCWLIKSILTT